VLICTITVVDCGGFSEFGEKSANAIYIVVKKENCHASWENYNSKFKIIEQRTQLPYLTPQSGLYYVVQIITYREPF